MNFAQRLMTQGAALLAKQSPQAEEVTLNGAEYSVNLNRLPRNPSGDPNGLKNVSTEEGSVIEFPLNAVIPERGDILTDSQGFKHRVEKVSHVGHALRLTCEVLR
jgi:hypothetical protein